jgi:hypothetical protein
MNKLLDAIHSLSDEAIRMLDREPELFYALSALSVLVLLLGIFCVRTIALHLVTKILGFEERKLRKALILSVVAIILLPVSMLIGGVFFANNSYGVLGIFLDLLAILTPVAIISYTISQFYGESFFKSLIAYIMWSAVEIALIFAIAVASIGAFYITNQLMS